MEIVSPLLAPGVVLVIWSLVVLMWLVATRLPAFAKAGLSIKTAPRGSRYVEVEDQMPAKVNWVSHNWSHLMEQPTLFYALLAFLVLAGEAGQLSIALAWGYTISRIVHSLWQALVNIVAVRIVIFTISCVCLIGLAGVAANRILIA